MNVDELLTKNKQLEEEVNILKEKLKKYTAPSRSKNYYEKHKDDIIKKTKEYKETTNYYATIPTELLDIILQYDGRIKYRNGKFVNIIHKNDERYNIITPIICKKIKIMETIELCDSGFYFQFCFNTYKCIGLAYEYVLKDKFEICYSDWRNHGIIQSRTYL